MAGGASHALALKNNGTVVGWGRSASAATPPSGLGYVVAIAASENISVALHGAIAPTIVAQPGHQSVGKNRPATFAASASGSPAPAYQWQMRVNGSADWTDLATGSVYSGVTSPTLGIGAVTPALNQNRYRLVAINTEGSAISNEAVLTLRTPYADWQEDKFTGNEAEDSVISGSNADPDGDGYVNLLEYALGLEPKAANGAGLPEVSATGGEWIYTYDRPADRSDVDYEVQVSTNLTDWSATGVTHERVAIDGETEHWRARYLLSATNVFFRLKVTQTE